MRNNHLRVLFLSLNAALALCASAVAQCTTQASATSFGKPMPLETTVSTWTTNRLPKLGSSAGMYSYFYYKTSTTRLRYVVLIGTKRADIPFLGHRLYVDPNSILVDSWRTTTLGLLNETCNFGIRIPNNQALCGAMAVMQIGIIDSRVKGGVYLTNGVEWRLGT